MIARLAEPTIRYCESNLTGWIVQPANAVSSLFISAAGIYILSRKRHAYSIYLGAIAVVLGVASFLYYATNTILGQLADLGMMFFLAALLLAAALRARLTKPQFLATVILGGGLPLALTAGFRTIGGFNLGIPLFALLLTAAVYLELKVSRQDNLSLQTYALAFLMLAVGFIFWAADYKRIWCSAATAHYINGHALWHLFNAAAIICINEYFARAENSKRQAAK